MKTAQEAFARGGSDAPPALLPGETIGSRLRNAAATMALHGLAITDADVRVDFAETLANVVTLSHQSDTRDANHAMDAAAHDGTREALALALRRVEALEQDNAKMREQRDNEAWQHAACFSIAEGVRGWDAPTANDSLAMRTARQLRRDFEGHFLGQPTPFRADGLPIDPDLVGTPGNSPDQAVCRHTKFHAGSPSEDMRATLPDRCSRIPRARLADPLGRDSCGDFRAFDVACPAVLCGAEVGEPCLDTGNDWYMGKRGQDAAVHAMRAGAWTASLAMRKEVDRG